MFSAVLKRRISAVMHFVVFDYLFRAEIVAVSVNNIVLIYSDFSFIISSDSLFQAVSSCSSEQCDQYDHIYNMSW